jgi:protein-tyrosine phosphatase
MDHEYKLISYITDNLYLSGIDALNKDTELKKYNIQAVICLGDIIDYHENNNYIRDIIKKKDFYFIKIDDNDQTNISKYFDSCNDFIENHSNVNILIHCSGGVSRSATITISYLLNKCRSATFDEIFQLVRNKRSIINPNNGFIRQLREYYR